MYNVALQGNVWGLVIYCIAHINAHIFNKTTNKCIILTVTLEMTSPQP